MTELFSSYCSRCEANFLWIAKLDKCPNCDKPKPDAASVHAIPESITIPLAAFQKFEAASKAMHPRAVPILIAEGMEIAKAALSAPGEGKPDPTSGLSVACCHKCAKGKAASINAGIFAGIVWLHSLP
jgi:hypothetical protein